MSDKLVNELRRAIHGPDTMDVIVALLFFIGKWVLIGLSFKLGWSFL